MGGASTEVSNETMNVLIEAANFDPVSIARSARRHKLPSEASKRFERGVDPEIAAHAIARVVQLLEVHAHGTGESLGAHWRNEEAKSAIFLPAGFAESIVGIQFSADETQNILSQIGCVVAVVDGGFEVIAPSWRPDIQHKADLAEELARIGGYDRIPARLPVAPPGRGLTVNQKHRRAILNALVGSGHTEVLNYPFLSAEQNLWFAQNQHAPAVRLANAMQEEYSEMRTSILPGLLEAAKRNLSRGSVNLAIFEEGSVFQPLKKMGAGAALPVGYALPTDKELNELNLAIPAQPKYLAAVFTGARVTQQVGQREVAASYQDAINAVLICAKAVGAELRVVQAQRAGFHPGRCAEFYTVDAKLIGVAGELDPALMAANDLPRRVAAAEINLNSLYEAAPAVIQAEAIGIMPAATQDLSLVVAVSVPAGELQQLIKTGAGELLESITLVDDYRGENVGEGNKSLTFALKFRALVRTLTQAEATDARDAAVKLAAEKFGAVLRA
jgi:phenylalanyl-tRNA synthetase beta chain